MNRKPSKALQVVAVNMLAVALLLAIAITIGRAQTPAGGKAQTEAVRPLSENDVVELLQGDVEPERVGEVAQTHGITFAIDSASEKELRDAGATDELLKELRAIARKPEAPKMAAPAQTPINRAEQPGSAITKGMTAGEFYKNIQVLKDIPAPQLMPAMQFMTGSLGVGCEFCHVKDAFDKDEKEMKKTARKMIQMTMAINLENFDGRRELTCNSCHHGAQQPAAIPGFPEEEPGFGPGAAGSQSAQSAKTAAGTGPGAPGPALPTADQLLAKYVQAMGGAAAIQKVKSRVEKGTTTTAAGGRFAVEVFAKAPDKRLSVMHTPNGDNITIVNGQTGWQGAMGRPPHALFGQELDLARLDADFYLLLHAKQVFNQLRPGRPEKVGDREAYLLLALRQNQTPVRFYFDEQTGLLVRKVRYFGTPLGLNPIQVDFADYRVVDGVKVPFRWTLSRLPGTRLTVQMDRIQQNVLIEDAKFAKPPAPAVARSVEK
jgi:photosynthetic reaction center cytochrome c subunit